jgi:cyclophilin family peptidyl-prolyl cis-trans isomerase
MRSATPRSIFAALCAVLLLATACSSSTTDTAGDAESAAVDTDAAGDDAPAVTTPDANAPADPALVEQYGFSLTGTPMSSEHTTCMLDLADGDTQLTAAFNGSSFTPEAFTALAISIHSCVEHDTLAASLLALGGADDEATQANFSECALEEIDDATDGDLTYVGLAALRVSFPVPEGAAESTVSAASNCVPVIGVANQVAAATEQGSGFLIEVDRDCLTDAIDDSFLTSFWESIVANEETEGLTDLVGDCSDEYDSGLPKEIPADFVAWSGEGTLAGVDPFVRNAAYDSAPPMVIDTDKDYEAVLTTTDGEMRIRLFTEAAPITVNNFVALAQDGYYDGTTFHRVIEGFMAQAGDPTGLGTGGPGYQFEDEATGLLDIDRRGLLAMANSGPNTNGSQFFITFDAATHLNGNHTVFGSITDGDDVLTQVDLRDPQLPTSRGEQLISVEIVELG